MLSVVKKIDILHNNHIMVIIFHICLQCAIKRLKGHVRREIVGRYENMLKYAELQKCKQANLTKAWRIERNPEKG